MHKNATLKMHNEIRRLVKLSDTLPDNDNIKAVDGPDDLNILIKACEHDSDYVVVVRLHGHGTHAVPFVLEYGRACAHERGYDKNIQTQTVAGRTGMVYSL